MAFQVENPAAFSGKDTDNPSGKFWIPIPSARFLADSKVADFVLPKLKIQTINLFHINLTVDKPFS